MVYLSPGISASITDKVGVYGFVQLPVYSRLDGYQLFPHWTAAADLRFLIHPTTKLKWCADLTRIAPRRRFNPRLDLRRRAVLGGAARLWIAGVCGYASSLAQANALEIGQLAPSLVLHTLDGKSIATRDLLGQVVIVTFWATWCEPCREELPLFSSYAVRHAQDGLRVLGFSLDGPEAMPKVRDVAET